MTIKQLQILTLLGQLKSFTLTAKALGTSQSAVSHTIKLLETEMGHSIFQRTSNELCFTEFGKQLYAKAETILNIATSIEEDATYWRNKHSGIVRLGSFGPTATMHLLPTYLETFKQVYPHIDVHIYEGRDAEVLHWLDTHRIDFGFVVLPKPDYCTKEVLTDHLVAVISNSHPLAEYKTITLKDIANFPFILTQAGSNKLVESLFQRQGITLKPQYSCTQLISTLDLIHRSGAVSILAESALPKFLLNELNLVTRYIDQCNTERKVGIAYREGTILSPAAQTFWSFLNRK